MKDFFRVKTVFQVQYLPLMNMVNLTTVCTEQISATEESITLWVCLFVALFVIVLSIWKYATSKLITKCHALVGSAAAGPRVSRSGSGDGGTATSVVPSPSPPGPWRFPIIGTLAMLRRDWLRSLASLRSSYGDVFQVKIGIRDIVVLNGWSTITKALANGSRRARQLAGRPCLHGFCLASKGKAMSFNGYSRTWRLHRRLSERVLSRAMFETRFIETTVVREAGILLDTFLRNGDSTAVGGGGSPSSASFDPEDSIFQSIAHAMFSLCYGDSRRSQFDPAAESNVPSSCCCPHSPPNNVADRNEDFDTMTYCSQSIVRCNDRGSIVDFFPWTRPFLRSSLSTLDRICAVMLDATRRMTARHRETRREGVVRDVIDALIEVADNTKTGKMLGVDRIEMTVQEFIGAGIDILAAALLWIVVYMATYPDVQERVRNEADKALSSAAAAAAHDESHADDAAATPGQRSSATPYAEAVILEVLRHCCVVPVALPHAAIGDVQINGYRIPSDRFVLINLYSACHDKEIWSNSEDFVPERFMNTPSDAVPTANKSGDSNLHYDVANQQRPPTTPGRRQATASFGFGKRRCVGERLSRRLLVVYLTTLVRGCYIEPAPGVVGGIDLSPRDHAIVLRPKPCRISIRPRWPC